MLTMSADNVKCNNHLECQELHKALCMKLEKLPNIIDHLLPSAIQPAHESNPQHDTAPPMYTLYNNCTLLL